MILANGKQCDPVIPQTFSCLFPFKAQTMAKFPVNYFVVALFAIAGCWAGRGQLPKEVEITSEASTTATTSDVQSTDSTDSTTVTATTTRPARTTTIGPPSKDCEESFFQGNSNVPCWTLGGKCYCFSTRNLMYYWSRADQYCRGGNFTLLSIETREEDLLIHNHIAAELPIYGSSYWTSGKFIIPQWEWASTEPFEAFEYTNWYPGAPNNNRPDYCAYVYFDYDFENGYWRDGQCSDILHFICEAID